MSHTLQTLTEQRDIFGQQFDQAAARGDVAAMDQAMAQVRALSALIADHAEAATA